MGMMSNWYTGAKAAVAQDGLKTTVWKLAKHQEHTYLNASVKKVGEDHVGNEYFEDTSAGKLRGRDRWVVYNNPTNSAVFDRPYQASSIPPTWHAWIHQMDDRPPPAGEVLDPIVNNFIPAGAEASSLPMYDHVAPWRQNDTGKGHEVEYRQPGHWQGGNYRVQTYSTWDGSVKKELSPLNTQN